MSVINDVSGIDIYNIVAEQGTTVRRTVVYSDAAGTPFDLSGATANMKIRKLTPATLGSAASVSSAYITLTTNNGLNITASAGQIDIEISAYAMSTIPAGEYNYDLEILRADGVTVKIFRGIFKVVQNNLGSYLYATLSSADWYVLARDYGGSGALLDQGPNKVHAKIGSVGVAQIVPAAGVENVLSLPGAAGNYCTVGPVSTVPIVCTNVDLRAEITSNLGADGVVVAHGDRLRLQVQSTGTVYVGVYIGGGITAAASIVGVVSAGVRMQIRGTLNTSTGAVTVYTRSPSLGLPLSDDTNWISAGSGTSVNTGTGSLTTDPARWQIGAYGHATPGSTNPFSGNIYAVRTILDGVTIFDVDFTAEAVSTSSFTASTGQIITVISGSGSDSNDPLFLQYSGEKYLYLPTAGGNALTTPHTAAQAWAATSTAVLEFDIDNSNWLSGSMVFVGKETGDPGRYYKLVVTGTGYVQFFWYPSGTLASSIGASHTGAAMPSSGRFTIKCTVQLNTGSGTRSITFARKPYGSDTWIDMGGSTGLAASSFGGTGSTGLVFGALTASGGPSEHKFYSGSITVDGTVVASFDASDVVSPYQTVTGGAGETWTINRGTSGRKAALVDQSLFLFGTDDYMEILDNDIFNFGAGQDFTAIIALRQHGGGVDFSQLFGKRQGTGNGWMIVTHPDGYPYGFMYDGTNTYNIAAGTYTGGYTLVAALRRQGTTGRTYLNGVLGGTSTVVSGDLSNTTPVRIGPQSGGTPPDIEFIGAAIFRRALSETELQTLLGAFDA